MRRFVITTISVLVLLCASVSTAMAESVEWKELSVSATAYNSVPWQTTANKPSVAAWGDELRNLMRAPFEPRTRPPPRMSHSKMSSSWRLLVLAPAVFFFFFFF